METPKKKLIHKLKNRYRLVIINDGTFEEKFSFSLTPMNVFVGFSSFLVFFAGIVSLLIIFTPLREYIPGYADPGMRNDLARLVYVSDSLEKVLQDRDSYYKNILNIMEDKVEYSDTAVLKIHEKNSSQLGHGKTSELEEDFRDEYEKEKDDYSLASISPLTIKSIGIQNLNFFNPVEGVVTNNFGTDNEHLAVDVATRPNEPVKAVLEGRVIFSSWTPETGHVIAIQHKNNIVSIYKHNAVLLKKTGTFVKVGEPIAIVGNSGELTTGPHLHFELWENCQAVNPEQFINF